MSCHIKDFFKINGKERIKMYKKGECVKFKNFEKKTKIIIYDLLQMLKIF